MEGKTQLIFETGGCCCLCLQSTGEFLTNLPEESKNISSFQSICQYLKLDLTKIFGGGSGIVLDVPLESLPSVEESEIKGTLCSGCAELSEQFTKLWEEMQIIQRQMKSCLLQVHQNICQTDNKEGTGNTLIQLKTNKLLQSQPETLANLEIVERLQKQIKEKCGEIFQDKPSSSSALNVENLADKIKVEIAEKAASRRPHIPLPNLEEEEDFEDDEEMEEETCDDDIVVKDEEISQSEEEEEEEEEFKEEEVDIDDEDEDEQVHHRIPGFIISSAPNNTAAGHYFDTLSCDICNITFETESLMICHKKYNHTSTQCHFCLKKFSSKNHLLSHQSQVRSCTPLLSLLGKKIRAVKYTCELCQKTFRSNQRLTEHNNVVHLKKIAKCRFCQKTFRMYGSLTQHIKRRACAGLRNRKQTPSASTSSSAAMKTATIAANASSPLVKEEVLTAEEGPKPEVKTEQEEGY